MKKYLTLNLVGSGGALKRYNLGGTTCLNWDPPAALAPDRMSPDPTEWEGRRAPRPVGVFTQEINFAMAKIRTLDL